MKTMQNKKGQSMGGLYGGILIVASIGILVALLLYVFASVGDSLRTANTAGEAINETIIPNTAGVNFAASSLNDASCGTVTVYNSSQLISAANYTQSGCSLANSTNTFTGTWNITYSYTYSADTASSNATDTMVTQFVDFLPWLGIILLVLAAGVVLFFVIRSFAGNRGV